ncbi:MULTISPECIES: carbohydrate ABC transporter permease [unclassified Actinomyces]|uniref:carbohydrate ABC transporter permease n=1 Tax=unclassified Actinomyces TaxID=2609248 RepID=UPI000D599C31|nr:MULTISPECIES: carbohydrate ABC transporter permease [unclassified Actinomyces]RAX21728.1 carbohydrate ABC transporter permease [Actinomyces sp. Z3]
MQILKQTRSRTPLKAKTRYTITNIWITILLAIGAVIMVAPLLWMFTTSLKDKEGVFALPPEWIPSPAHWDTYLRIWTEGPLASGIKNSLVVSLSVTIVGSFVSALAAFAFAKMRLPGTNGLFLLLLSGMMIPFPTLMIPQFMMFSRIGWVDTLLPLIVPGMFGNIMMIFFLRQYLTSTPDSLIEAARVDGASFPQIFFRMILPLIRPAIAAQFILWFMGVWNDYLAPTIYLNSPEKLTLQLVIANFNSNYAIQSDYPLIMAASIVALLPIFVIFLVFQRQIIESVALTGTKA